MRADKAIWPSQAANIVPACCIITELLFHLLERPRIVYPRDRISIGFHPLTVSVSARSVKGIPSLRNWLPFGCTQRLQTRCRLAQLRVEAADAEPRQGGLQPVDDARALAGQFLELAVRPLGVLFRECRHHNHFAMTALAAQ